MKDLIEASKAGDLDAFNHLIDYYSLTVERFAFQIGVSYHDVPDVSQEVFIRVYRYINTFDGKSSFTSWLYKITLNIARDYMRKQSTWLNKFSLIKREQRTKEQQTKNLEHELLRGEENRLLYKTILQLDEKYRVPIILHYFHDLTNQEIAEITESKLSTTKVRMMRGKKYLQEKLEEGGIKRG